MSELHQRNTENTENKENSNDQLQENKEEIKENKPKIEIQNVPKTNSNEIKENVVRNSLGMIEDTQDDGYLKKEEIPIYIKEICQLLFYLSIPIIIISCILASISIYYLYSRK